MITLYRPSTGTFVAAAAKDVSDPLLLQLNMLIELRAMTLMLLDAQRGVVTQTIEQYRSDVVNDAVNPPV